LLRKQNEEDPEVASGSSSFCRLYCPAFPQFTHTLGVGRLIEAKRVLNAAIVRRILSSNDWLSAVLTIPEHCDEWLAAYFLRFIVSSVCMR